MHPLEREIQQLTVLRSLAYEWGFDEVVILVDACIGDREEMLAALD
jgi:hypothetical protein